jgi:two-component system, LytTR family, response regulator
MLKTIIVEDDPLSMEMLCDLIEDFFPQLQIVERCNLSASAIRQIRQLQPDLVLLDIDLPDQTGLKMLEDLDTYDFDVIFITAHEKYALDAHQFESSGYLVKPVSKTLLENALKRVKSKKQKIHFGEQLRQFQKQLRLPDLPQKIAVASQKETQFIDIKDIVRLEADGNYTTIFRDSKENIFSSKQIGEYENSLKPCGFFRIHDKHIINSKFLKSYIKGDGGLVTLHDQTELPVSRRKKEEFLVFLNNIHL